MFKKATIIFTAILLTLSVTACGSAKDKSMQAPEARDQVFQEGKAENNSVVAPKEDSVNSVAPNITSVATQQVNRKVIFNATFDVQTKDYDKTINELNMQTEGTKSYIQSSNTYGDKLEGNARATFVIRVPSDKYEGLKGDISKLGNVISSSEGGEDVTGDYFDKDARLTVLKAQEKRILELLNKAQTVEDIIKIESELSRVRQEIEQLTTVIKRYDDLIAYSTITLNIYQTSDYIVKDDGFFSKLLNTVKDSLKFGLKLLQNIVYVIVWLIPYLIVLTIIIFIVKKILKNRKIKNLKKLDNKQEE